MRRSGSTTSVVGSVALSLRSTRSRSTSGEADWKPAVSSCSDWLGSAPDDTLPAANGCLFWPDRWLNNHEHDFLALKCEEQGRQTRADRLPATRSGSIGRPMGLPGGASAADGAASTADVDSHHDYRRRKSSAVGWRLPRCLHGSQMSIHALGVRQLAGHPLEMLTAPQQVALVGHYRAGH